MGLIRGMQGGVTLIELMVTVAVLSILLTVGVPSLTRFVEASRIDAAERQIIAAVKLARSEAVAKQRQITICPLSGSGSSCGKNWAGGMLIYENRVAPAEFQQDKDERVKIYDYSSDLAVTINRNRLSFNAFGRTGTTATISIDPSTQDPCNIKVDCVQLAIASSGRIRRK